MDFDDLLDILKPMNPWWENIDWVKKDQEIQNFSDSTVKWNPRLMYLIYRRIIQTNTTGIITVRGPRRLGKTTMIKRLIQMMIENSKINPRRIVYIQCDDPSIDYLYDITKGALKNLIGKYIEYAGTSKYPLRYPLFFFLDEATFYKGNWAREVKSLVDRGYVHGKALIYVTGSSALDIDTSRRLLTGRQGEILEKLPSGSDQFLYPMRFVELVETIDNDIGEFLKRYNLLNTSRRFTIFKILTTPKEYEHIQKIFDYIEANFKDRLEELLDVYILGGGYPRILHYLKTKDNIPPTFYDEIYNTVVLDAEKLELEKRVMETTLEVITKNHVNATSVDYNDGILNEIARRVGIKKIPGSVHPIQKYIDYLVNLKFVVLLFSVNIGGRYPIPKKYGSAKIYFRDPFVFQAVYSKLNAIPNPYKHFRKIVDESNVNKDKKDAMSKIIEGVMGAHVSLLPFLLNPTPNYNESDSSGIYRYNNKEIDLIAWTISTKTGKPLVIPIEVKYRYRIRNSDLNNARIFGKKIKRRVIVATQKEYKIEDDIALIPVPWLLLLM